jgi:hypothetical protein
MSFTKKRHYRTLSTLNCNAIQPLGQIALSSLGVLTVQLFLSLWLTAFAFVAGLSRTAAKMTHPKVQRRTHGSQPLHWRLARLHPPDKNVNSANRSLIAACHFGGKMAQMAIFVPFASNGSPLG